MKKDKIIIECPTCKSNIFIDKYCPACGTKIYDTWYDVYYESKDDALFEIENELK